MYIGSADMMTRNTEKRVEVACPVYDEDLRARLNHMLQVMLEDNVKARVLDAAGTYLKMGQGEPFVDAQEVFMQEAVQAAAVKKPAKRSIQGGPLWHLSQIKEGEQGNGEIALHSREAECGAGICKKH